MRVLQVFQQHTDPRLPGGAGKGVCLLMSCWYLINAAKGDDYWDWFAANAAVVRDLGNRTVPPEHYFREMRSVGNLEFKGKIECSNAYLADALLDNGIKATGVWPWRLAVMDNPGFKQAHAIALYWGMKLRILDVTEGEFEFDSAADCRRWLIQHNAVPRVRFGAAELPYSSAFPKLTVYGFVKSAG